jgi:predicted RNA-binding Zn-ribbon protein involved in translation (DUF1610 family)
MDKTRCISCGNYVEVGKGSTEFQCPECERTIGRCARCRTLGVTYKCECGFEGP